MPAIRHVQVVVNPSARSGRAGKVLRQARKLATVRQDMRVDWIESRSGEHLHQLVRAAQLDDVDAVAVGGGDGTGARALGAMDGPNRIPLGVLPIGSGNDFARDLGIPITLPEVLDLLASATGRWVDVARVTPGGARFCCVASVGLD